MGGLAHYIEDEGIATTQLSLIRLHTEKTRPPRALWVPFELGRPLGSPARPALQRRVLLADLELLEAPSGPVLVDFEEDAPEDAQPPEAWACPVDFSTGASPEDGDEIEREIAELESWHALAVRERGTTMGASGLDVEEIKNLVLGLLDGTAPRPRGEVTTAALLRLACEDLRAYYSEALTAQPGQSEPTGAELEDWFFGETAAGRALIQLKKSVAESSDQSLRDLADHVPIPLRQAKRSFPSR